MKTKRFLSVMLAAIVLVSLVSCSAANDMEAAGDVAYPGASGNMSGGAAEDYVEKPTEDGYYSDSSAGVGSLDALEAVTETSRKRIQYVTVSIESTEYDTAVTAIKTRASELGGYIETSEERGLGVYGNGNRYSHIVFRIPSERLDEFKGDLAGIGNLLSVNVTTDDVTESYYDIEARLASLEAQRDRYMALLEEAKSLEEILILDDALAEVLYQIESYTGTLNKYDSLSAYSTVTVNLQEVKELTEEEEDPETFGERIAASFTDSVDALAEFFKGAVVVIAAVVPWVALPAVIVIVILICVKRSAKKREKPQESDEE